MKSEFFLRLMTAGGLTVAVLAPGATPLAAMTETVAETDVLSDTAGDLLQEPETIEVLEPANDGTEFSVQEEITAEADGPVQEEPAVLEEVEEQDPAVQAEDVCILNGQGYTSVQAALDAIGENGTGTIDLTADSSDIALIRKGQTITINIHPGVVWDNSQHSTSGWGSTVLANQGTLILNSQGTIQADASKGQSFCLVNDYGASALVNGGTFTSGHGDYLVRNYGMMTIDGDAFFLKQHEGSPSMITNGWYGPVPTGAQPARLIVNSCRIEATVDKAIGIKNDDNSDLVFNGGSINTTINIQNNNVAVINGGIFTSKGTSPNIVNNYVASIPQYARAELVIHGGDFYAASEAAPAIRIQNKGTGTIQIDGGTYFADQDIIKDHLVSPCVLREIPGSDPVRYQVVIPVTRITVDPAETRLYAGQTVTLTATVEPENATFRTVSWNNLTPDIVSMEVDESDPDQAKVILTALAEGEARIEAQADGQSAMAEVTVLPATLSISPTEKTIQEKESFTIVPLTQPADLADEILWTSSDPEVATVSEDGTVTGVKAGKAVITASVKAGPRAGLQADCQVTVEKAPGEPETPDQPQEPENPETPDQPQEPESPETPEQPEEPGESEQPGQDEPEQKPVPVTPDSEEKDPQPAKPEGTEAAKVETAAVLHTGFWSILAASGGIGAWILRRKTGK